MPTHNGSPSLEAGPTELVPPELPLENQVELVPLREPVPTAVVDPLAIAPRTGDTMGSLYIGARAAFPDGMALALATHRRPYEEIRADYAAYHEQPEFSDVDFFNANFDPPEPNDAQLVAPPGRSLSEHILAIRSEFIHPSVENTSFDVWLPYDRSVAGAGRFNHHSFLWDGYHMAKGYAADGLWDLVLNIADNTEYQINRFGHALNGSAAFLATRSQPPYFSHEVSMLADRYGEEALVRYLPTMEKEYEGYWMDGQEELDRLPEDGMVHTNRALVRLPGGAYLNRYWDDAEGPRLESYQEDTELGERVAHGLAGAEREQRLQQLFKHIRAGAASGWDFSSRWFGDGSTMETIETADVLPVDLNSLLARTEQVLARAHRAAGNEDRAVDYDNRFRQRIRTINKFLWDGSEGMYRDYNFRRGHQTGIVSAAMAYPLYVGISSARQTQEVAQVIEERLLFPGGVVATTTDESDQQWDGGTPEGNGQKNVWAPLSWAAARGLARRAHMLREGGAHIDVEPLLELSERVRNSYMNGIELAYAANRTIPEKHRGDDPAQIGTGGEYQAVGTLAMSAEIYRALDRWRPRDPNGCLPVGSVALAHA